MLPRVFHLGLAAVVIVGCQAATKNNAYENDPLVLSKKPVESNPADRLPTQLAEAEPLAPPFPTVPHGPDSVAGLGGVRAQPVAILKAPIIVTPAVRLSGGDADDPVAFGHASDLSWLQGVLDRYPDGHVELRYSTFTLGDRWGGKVRLDDDAHLRAFHDGDVIRVEGAMVPGQPPLSWDQAPRYKAWAFRLVRGGD